MISIKIIITLLVLHFIADFICQSDWMATNKSSRVWPLFVHVLVYSLIFLLPMGEYYALANGFLHFCVDYVTSTITKRLWLQEKKYWFLRVNGLDQLIHTCCLFLTYLWFY